MRTPLRAGIALLIAALAMQRGAGPEPAAAQEPARVAIHFEIVDARFRAPLVAAGDLESVESRMAAVVAGRLREWFGYLRFVPDGDEPERLTFSIDRKDPDSTSPFVERGLWVRLTRPARDTAAYWFDLAGPGPGGAGSGDALAAQIDAELRRADRTLVQRFLGDVPVAREALAQREPPGWALPFRRDALCIRDSTRLKVVNVERIGIVTQPRPYEAIVLGTVTGHPGPEHERFHQGLFGEALTEFGEGQVTEVYVTRPLGLPNCPVCLLSPLGGGESCTP